MGAKQSKRSVDISGKEAEGASEVAAAGAGGEGKLEAIDVDGLKPQLNGDAQHITPPEEKTDKEKQLDSGTPENEKDATTEKESKEKEEEKEAPVTNGDSEKPEEKENGDAPAPDAETKKPKKEKVKKKWSLRSISFSRKDKPKQEKKQKDEEAKTNGEPEKVPEEAAEAVAVAEEKATEEAKPEAEAAAEKTPETPATEPLTNGSSAPATPQEAPAAAEPDQLPLNGLSLQEPKPSEPESKSDEPTVEPKETTPAPEIPVKSEVCVEPPTVESTPPPLPANPPPSSVASFAATTMAPELTDAALANVTELAPPPSPPAAAEAVSTTPPPPPQDDDASVEVVKGESIRVPETVIENNVDNQVVNEDLPEEVVDEMPPAPESTETLPEPEVESLPEPEIESLPEPEIESLPEPEVESLPEPEVESLPEPEVESLPEPEVESLPEPEVESLPEKVAETLPEPDESLPEPEAEPLTNGNGAAHDDVSHEEIEKVAKQTVEDIVVTAEKTDKIAVDAVAANEPDLANSKHMTNGVEGKVNGSADETEHENRKNKSKDLRSNGAAADGAPEPQEVLPISDKMADLIPEVPELPTETAVLTEASSDVAVAN